MIPKNKAFSVLLLLSAAVCWTACSSGTVQHAEAGEAQTSVAATIGDQSISFEELDAKAKEMNAELFQNLYDTRRAALEQVIAERLLDQKAQSLGMTQEQLIQQEIIGKTAPISDEQISQFYEQNKQMMGGKDLDEMRAQVQRYLANQQQQKMMADYMRELRKDIAVSILLQPPRIDVTVAENDPRMGPVDAPILIVEYSDFQ